MRKIITVMMGCAVVLAYGTSAMAFHDSGTLVCSQCHTMHYSQDGATPSGADSGGPFDYLLLKSNSTDLCLSCHDGTGNYGTQVGSEYAPNVYDPTNDFPGGHFDDVAGDDAMGHNPGGTALGSDTVTPAPGGSFVSADLRCTSCHDVHGNSNFRILKSSAGGGSNAAPVEGTDAWETVIDDNGWTGEGATKHNGYKQKFSDWCANCHGNFHGSTNQQSSTPYKRHPTSDDGTANQGKLTSAMVTNYGTTYNPVIPFEDTDVSAADTDSSVSTDDKVFCLSCHRAHGSANKDAGRWNFAAASGAGANCNKCHAK